MDHKKNLETTADHERKTRTFEQTNQISPSVAYNHKSTPSIRSMRLEMCKNK